MRHESKTWVATFDGQLGRVYAQGSDGNLRHLAEEGMDSRPNAEERPDTGSLRKALPHVDDAGFITEQQFVDTFTKHLADRARSGAFDKLIVSAAPKALATFRDAAPQELRGKVTAELNKDYVHTPVKQLEQAISEHL
jgi:protein required for attachment to host cells